MSGHADHDLEQLRDRVPIAGLIGRHVELTKRAGEYVGLCPFHSEKTGSFTVSPGKGFYHCFGCGAHGDQVGFLRQFFGLDFKAAIEALAREAGVSSVDRGQRTEDRPRVQPRAAARPARSAARSSSDWTWELIRSILGDCRPAEGTPVEAYLRARAIDVDAIGGIPMALLFHPALKHSRSGLVFPAMVAKVIGPNGRLCGLHRTYLEADSAAKAPVEPAKMMVGDCHGGAVPFDRGRSATVIAAEGIETALSCLQLNRSAGNADQVLAALTFGNIHGAGLGQGKRRRRDDPRYDRKNRSTWRLPSTTPDPSRPGLRLRLARDVVIAAERGNKDEHAYRALLERAIAKFRAAGQRVRVAWPAGGDFNDDLMAGAEA